MILTLSYLAASPLLPVAMACCAPCPPCSPCAPPCRKYVQPPIPKSFKPVQTYTPPTVAVEGCTIYKKSFCPPDCCDCRPPPLRLHDNLKPAACPLDDNTTHKMSFTGACAPAAKPVLPCDRNVIGEGPLSCITTQRHDYVPKPITKLDPIVPPTLLRCSEKPLEDVTIMQASYQCPAPFEPQISYKPIAVYKKPDKPFQDETIAKLSYVPWPAKTKEHYPWACKGSFAPPTMPMEKCTVMKCSYMDVCGDHRRPPMTPPANTNPITQEKDVECCTIYKKSFCPPDCCDCRPPPLRLHDNLKPAACPLDDNTTHRMSFTGACAPAAKPVLPCDRNVIGEGPLSCITTQRHDYVPKPITKLDPIVPPTLLRCSEKPLEDVTIMQASYQCPVPFEQQRSYKPIAVYQKPDKPFQDETIAKLSYVPWPAKQKEHYPWACKGKFECPCIPVEGTTIYKSSYFPPGDCVETCTPAPCAPRCPPDGVCKASCFGSCPQCVAAC